MNVEDAVSQLRAMYSDDDPITYKGEYTTPNGLLEIIPTHVPAAGVRITYSGGTKHGVTRNVRGTLTGMIKDRSYLKNWRV